MAAVARRLGVSRSYLSRLMSGERKVIGDATIANACAALGLPRDYFDDPAFEGTPYTEAVRFGAPPIDHLTLMLLAASGEALASHAQLVLEAIDEGAPLSRPLRHLVSSARATLYLERHEEVVALLNAQAPEADLRKVAHAYALAMRHLGEVLGVAGRVAKDVRLPEGFDGQR